MSSLPNGSRSFGPFRLVPAEQSLYEDTRRVRIGSRAFEILLALSERPGQLITTEELFERVWPRMQVDSGALRVHIAALRKALGTTAGGAPYIVNIAGRGYKLVAPSTTGTDLPGELPSIKGRMVGRDHTVEAIARSLGQRRLVTVTGPGGIGKTTVALAAATHLRNTYPDGVRFVDLTALADPALVPGAIAAAVQARVSDRDAVADLLSALRDRTFLLLLDNCEHLIDKIANLAEQIIAAAPGVAILATSREPLRAVGEGVHRLAPLALPPSSPAADIDAVRNAPAVQLFVERVRAAEAALSLSDADILSIGDICARVDGIPLAIELAAARVALLGVHGVAEQLKSSFALLAGGLRTGHARHRTLRATLDWSFQLLSDTEQALLRRLSVFRGEFTLAAAAAIAEGLALADGDLVEHMANLVAKSLMLSHAAARPARYRLLETTRLYALQELQTSGEVAAVSRLHFAYFREQLRIAASDWETMPTGDWVETYAHKIDNVRAALDWSLEQDNDIEGGAALTAASSPLWFHLALVPEYRGRIQRALAALARRDCDRPDIEMRLQVALGAATFNLNGAVPEIEAASARALEIATRLGATDFQLHALWGLARGRYVHGDYQTALGFCEQFDAVVQTSGDAAAALVRDRMMALALHLVGRQPEARVYAERALTHPAVRTRTIHQSFHEYDSRVASRSHLARVLWLQGFPDRARTIMYEGLQYARDLDYAPTLCYILVYTAHPIAFWTGDLAAVRSFIQLLVAYSADVSFGYWRAWSRCYQVALNQSQGDVSAGATSLSAALAGTGYSPVFGDMLATINPHLIDPMTAARAKDEPGRWSSAEVLRISATGPSGQAPAAAGPEAEALLLRSLSLAQDQGARSWQLRTATSLARLYIESDRSRLAHDVLAPVYESFTEGLETADLRAAAAVLRQLQDGPDPQPNT